VFAQAGVAVLAYGVTILVVASLLAVSSAAFVVVGESVALSEAVQLAAHELGPDPEAARSKPGLPVRVSALIAAGAFVVLSVTEWVLARPPKKGVDWQLSGGSDAADALFGELVPRWQIERSNWEASAKQQASAEARAELKQAARDVREAAKPVSGELAAALDELTSESEDLDLAGRRWYRLVEQVNEASRKSRLPYYLDPSVVVREDGDARGENVHVERYFSVYPYRIDTANRYDVDGQDYATLMVRRLGLSRDGHNRLGFSRDVQPFALVVLDEVDDLARQTESDATTGSCGRANPGSRDAQVAYATCAKAIARLVEESEGGARDALLLSTERHELQHQIDGPDLELSKEVLRRLAVYAPTFQDRVNRELSAYVAELTADGMAPRFGLVALAPFVFGDKHPGAYHFAAVFVFESMSGKRIRKGAEPYGDLDFDRFDAVLSDLMALSDDELRAKARAAYDSLYGSELAEPKRLSKSN
jgi:hypothetical protein